jgi:hypothetical protein
MAVSGVILCGEPSAFRRCSGRTALAFWLGECCIYSPGRVLETTSDPITQSSGSHVLSASFHDRHGTPESRNREDVPVFHSRCIEANTRLRT